MPRTFEARQPAAPSAAEELASSPDAAFWAEHCGWVPGTGHCGNRGCEPACIFHAQRSAEHEHVLRLRRVRRVGQQPSRGRLPRSVRCFLFFAGFGGGLVWPLLGLDAVAAL